MTVFVHSLSLVRVRNAIPRMEDDAFFLCYVESTEIVLGNETASLNSSFSEPEQIKDMTITIVNSEDSEPCRKSAGMVSRWW